MGCEEESGTSSTCVLCRKEVMSKKYFILDEHTVSLCDECVSKYRNMYPGEEKLSFVGRGQPLEAYAEYCMLCKWSADKSMNDNPSSVFPSMISM